MIRQVFSEKYEQADYPRTTASGLWPEVEPFPQTRRTGMCCAQPTHFVSPQYTKRHTMQKVTTTLLLRLLLLLLRIMLRLRLLLVLLLPLLQHHSQVPTASALLWPWNVSSSHWAAYRGTLNAEGSHFDSELLALYWSSPFDSVLFYYVQFCSVLTTIPSLNVGVWDDPGRDLKVF
jgi:hypothetical protein